MGGLKQQEFIISQFKRPEEESQELAGFIPSGDSKEKTILSMPVGEILVTAGNPWHLPVDTPLQALPPSSHYFSVTLCPFLFL